MNKVIVITYLFPPSKKVGALRSRGIARYLPEFGWEPLFVVPVLPGEPPPGFNLTETHPPYRKMLRYYFDRAQKKRLKNMFLPLPQFHKRVYSFIRGSVDFPDNMAGWLPFAADVACRIIRRENIKHMITISGPMTCHLAGDTIKKKFPGIFWLADYRDPWTIYEKGTPVKRAEKNLEKKAVSGVDAISIVTDMWAEDYGRFFPDKKVYTIPNGFDPGEINPGGYKLTDEFTIVHTGELYPERMSPEPLFAALSQLLKEGRISSFSLRFYGDKQEWLVPMAEKYGIGNFVTYCGRAERNKILDIQRESQVLFIPEIKFLNGKGRLTAKIYEYLAAMRPVLYTGKEDTEISRLLKETRAGMTCPGTEAIKGIVSEWYAEWTEKGAAGYCGVKEDILKHSHRQMAKKFAAVLNGN